MPLGILTSIAACPAIIGTTEAVRQGQKQNAKEAHRGRKANLYVSCNDPSRKSRDIHGGTVVLRNNKLYVTNVNPKSKFLPEEGEDNVESQGYQFAGYFFGYPNSNWGKRGEGYVSTISDDPPQLNWIYVDKDTYEIKYGLKVQAEGNLVGPWNITPIDRRLNFDGWEGFTMVEEEEGVWALYFDVDDDGLAEKVPVTQRIMEVELTRREVKMRKGDTIMK
ncbi:uncharacterized protein RSE6_01777 [Rhynchosporium secalis]|uniref:Uncharacterized protein n=1 Tax=Rhynchosporium secalis TaxID=38038 RepID=A0A1E1LYJ7_RHYSE|nr:uncharacterized protein RSE6_01777 [Rhynchosporium secalis]